MASGIRTAEQLPNMRTVAQLNHEYDRLERQWRQSPEHERIHKLLQDSVAGKRKLIKQCICVAIGDLNTVNQEDFEMRIRQLVIFMDLHTYVSGTSSNPNALSTSLKPAYVQELPSRLTTEDEAFFKSKGLQLVLPPQAEHLVDSSTFLYAPAFPKDCLVLDFLPTSPVVCIGTDIHSLKDDEQTQGLVAWLKQSGTGRTEAELQTMAPITREFLKKRSAVDFLDDYNISFLYV